jgi:hypothetical protein
MIPPPLAALLGAVIVLATLRDGFETLVLPETVNRRFRLVRIFYVVTWAAWTGLVVRLATGRRRQGLLGVYGPLSLLVLFALWAGCLVFGFALVQWGLGSHLDWVRGASNFGVDLYMSGTTFFTLGLGDVTPNDTASRILTVVEAGLGFGFLAVVIGYLPVLYQAFSRREIIISLLDARAGSPPTAEVFLRRVGSDAALFERLLIDWERWAAELMESHLSYPALAFYRSQHQNQSWIAALTTVLDVSAFAMASARGPLARQARLTFAMARHAVVDLSQIFHAPPHAAGRERLAPGALQRMREHLAQAGVAVHADAAANDRLAELRSLYEPYVEALARRFLFEVPGWSPEREKSDNWKTSGWDRVARDGTRSPSPDLHDDGMDEA